MNRTDHKKQIAELGREAADMYVQRLKVAQIADFMGAKLGRPVTRSLIYYWIRTWRGNDLFNRGERSAQEAAKKYTIRDLKRWKGYLDSKMDAVELMEKIMQESGCGSQTAWKYMQMAARLNDATMSIDIEYKS